MSSSAGRCAHTHTTPTPGGPDHGQERPHSHPTTQPSGNGERPHSHPTTQPSRNGAVAPGPAVSSQLSHLLPHSNRPGLKDRDVPSSFPRGSPSGEPGLHRVPQRWPRKDLPSARKGNLWRNQKENPVISTSGPLC